jgi:sulfur-oxidizing protein SoxX
MLSKFIAGTGAALVFSGMVLMAQPALAAGGSLPTADVCKAKPTDVGTQGGCVVLDRRKGNCMACHQIPGAGSAGDIAPPLVAIKQRFPDKAKLRTQVANPAAANPNTVMPPFGKHDILSEEEIDKVVEFLLTL